MSWSPFSVVRLAFPPWSGRQLIATIRIRVDERAREVLDRALDVVITSLLGRDALYQLVDDVVEYLVANPSTRELVDDIIEYLAVQPAVREIVHSQGAHLTDDVIDEAREHLVRADAVVDRLVSTTRRRLRISRVLRRRDPERSR